MEQTTTTIMTASPMATTTSTTALLLRMTTLSLKGTADGTTHPTAAKPSSTFPNPIPTASDDVESVSGAGDELLHIHDGPETAEIVLVRLAVVAAAACAVTVTATTTTMTAAVVSRRCLCRPPEYVARW